MPIIWPQTIDFGWLNLEIRRRQSVHNDGSIICLKSRIHRPSKLKLASLNKGKTWVFLLSLWTSNARKPWSNAVHMDLLSTILKMSALDSRLADQRGSLYCKQRENCFRGVGENSEEAQNSLKEESKCWKENCSTRAPKENLIITYEGQACSLLLTDSGADGVPIIALSTRPEWAS